MSTDINSLLAKSGGRIRLLEAHDHNSIESVRSIVDKDRQGFHGIWISGLTQTTYLGIPDTEMISPLSRAKLLPEVNKHPQKGKYRPLCSAYDADSGGSMTEIPALVILLTKAGFSMVIVEDKTISEPGKKTNSLGNMSCLQKQTESSDFVKVIQAFKSAAAHGSFLMHMGNNAVLAGLSQHKVVHIVIYNGVHSSTGHHPLMLKWDKFVAIAVALPYRQTFLVNDAEGLERACRSADWNALIVVAVNDNVRNELPRPTESPQQLK